ncbi:hypothetical protein IQ279_16060 [Streptomyces verrucosisporus]|uniref:hypothetical protein n=1 Tax=Streptomyces verrucosisporus TaxID=1695161 RepID=UPI0019D15877|nr:hypothetical protein [Streptomyces verrucosisporus]MBN3931127.1 hypothetical protein [Streptomyces verrucosisporus]
MSSSDPNTPNDPYRKNPYDRPPGGQPPPAGQPGGYQGPYGGPGDQPLAPPPGPMGSPGGPPGGPPGAMPGKVNSSRMIFFITGGLQALFSLLAIVTFAAAEDDLEEAYGDLGVGTGIYYTLFVLFLLHAIAGIVLAAKFPQGGNGLRIAGVAWSAVLVLIGLATLPLGLLWLVLGIVCIVLLSSAESAAWFNRPRA